MYRPVLRVGGMMRVAQYITSEAVSSSVWNRCASATTSSSRLLSSTSGGGRTQPAAGSGGGEGEAAAGQPKAGCEREGTSAGAGHLVVVGGNGHLGSAICEAAVRNGFAVKSLSRRGEPPAAAIAGGWAASVEWIQADAMEPGTYEHELHGAAGVVHTVGTLMENDLYKKALRRGNPAQYNGANYELVNRDAALRVAETAAKVGVGALLFFSAASAPPGVDPRYLSTKREAERAVLALDPPTRGLVFRPGFMYSEHEPATMAIGTALLGAGTAVKMLNLGPLARAVTGMAGIELDTLRPLRTADVATAAVAVLRDEAYSGIFEIHAIKRIADQS